jgi:prepilin-type processing-associated H-X9-DG protein
MLFDGYLKDRAALEYFNFLAFARHKEGVVINFVDGHANSSTYRVKSRPT